MWLHFWNPKCATASGQFLISFDCYWFGVASSGIRRQRRTQSPENPDRKKTIDIVDTSLMRCHHDDVEDHLMTYSTTCLMIRFMTLIWHLYPIISFQWFHVALNIRPRMHFSVIWLDQRNWLYLSSVYTRCKKSVVYKHWLLAHSSQALELKKVRYWVSTPELYINT